MSSRLGRLAVVLLSLAPLNAQNLLPDPSIEAIQPPNQFGVPFAQWSGWKFEGDCKFDVGRVVHDGAHSAVLLGGNGAKIRLFTPTPNPSH